MDGQTDASKGVDRKTRNIDMDFRSFFQSGLRIVSGVFVHEQLVGITNRMDDNYVLETANPRCIFG